MEYKRNAMPQQAGRASGWTRVGPSQATVRYTQTTVVPNLNNGSGTTIPITTLPAPLPPEGTFPPPSVTGSCTIVPPIGIVPPIATGVEPPIATGVEPPIGIVPPIATLPPGWQVPQPEQPTEECGFCKTLGMAYVPMQQWNEVYEAETGFGRGTIFPELDLPFEGEGSRR